MIEVYIWNEEEGPDLVDGQFNLDSTVLKVEEFTLEHVLDAMHEKQWRMTPGRIFMATTARAEPGMKGAGLLFMPVPEDDGNNLPF